MKAATGDNSLYNFDNNLLPGLSFYRLKMIDHDGNFSYSDIVKLVNNIAETNLSISPNPAENVLTLNHPKATAGAAAKLYSITGLLLITQGVELNTSQTNIDVTKLRTGIYVVKYYTNLAERAVRFKKY